MRLGPSFIAASLHALLEPRRLIFGREFLGFNNPLQGDLAGYEVAILHSNRVT